MQNVHAASNQHHVEKVTDTGSLSDSEDSDDDDDSYSADIPTNGEAAEMFDKCLLWYEHQKESLPTSALLLKKIRDLAAAKQYSSLKQMKLQSFTTNTL